MPDAPQDTNGRGHRGWRWWLAAGLLGVVGLFVLIQLVPYGRDHTNPPTTAEPAWDSPQTRTLFMNACGDCHSNITTWPWYSNVAPISWLVQRDVVDGRAKFDVSNWDKPQDVSAGDIADAINGGGMPPWYYSINHSKSKLSPAENAQLIAGIQRTFAASPPKGGGGG